MDQVMGTTMTDESCAATAGDPGFVNAAVEKIIRPIVEGQIRGFLKEHPPIVEAVDWYKPRKDKALTFTNSLAKRIVRDLTCPTVRARLAEAFAGTPTGNFRNSTVAGLNCGEGGRLGKSAEPPAALRFNAARRAQLFDHQSSDAAPQDAVVP